ncbi:MAG: hypothetical protein AB7J30_13015 [Hyphomicrobium sp.]|uniref:hypothetical protein n=1 Tax=Hyphomicrobium sp. TaxID=82 RepID=UPI003D14E5DE
MSEEEMRLGCLRAALELRTAGSTAEELLALAERFHGFVLGRDAAKAEAESRATARRR